MKKANLKEMFDFLEKKMEWVWKIINFLLFIDWIIKNKIIIKKIKKKFLKNYLKKYYLYILYKIELWILKN
jgi:hypothetical protein